MNRPAIIGILVALLIVSLTAIVVLVLTRPAAQQAVLSRDSGTDADVPTTRQASASTADDTSRTARGSSAGSGAPTEPVFRDRPIRLHGVFNDACAAAFELPHIDVDTATVFPNSNRSMSIDFTYGSVCFGNEGLFIESGVLFGPVEGPTDRTACETAARAGSESPYPAKRMKQGQAFCTVTDEGNVAMLQVTAVEGVADDQNLPTITLATTLWQAA